MAFSLAFAVKRTHRVPAVPPKSGTPPRPLLAQLLNCKYKDLILEKVTQKGVIQYENSEVSMFPDFSLELQKQRAFFNETKQKLSKKGVEYSMAYLARLRVEDGGDVMYFSTHWSKPKNGFGHLNLHRLGHGLTTC